MSVHKTFYNFEVGFDPFSLPNPFAVIMPTTSYVVLTGYPPLSKSFTLLLASLS